MNTMRIIIIILCTYVTCLPASASMQGLNGGAATGPNGVPLGMPVVPGGVAIYNSNTNNNVSNEGLTQVMMKMAELLSASQSLMNVVMQLNAKPSLPLQMNMQPTVHPLAQVPVPLPPPQGTSILQDLNAASEKKSSYRDTTTSLSLTKLGVCTSCFGVLCAWIKMRLLANTAIKNSHWATWRSDIPSHVLVELTDEEIVGQLWQALLDHYAPERDQIVDVFAILRSFLDDIRQERSCLRDLLWWYRMIRTLKLSSLLGNEVLEHKAQQRCHRLDLLEDCVHTWANTCLCNNGIAKKNDKIIS